MISVNVLFLLATFTSVVAFSSILESFYSVYSLVPFISVYKLESAWKICPKNSTTQEKYKEVFEEFNHCYNGFVRNNQSLCHNFENKVEKCSRPIADFFVDCLPEESKDLPPAIVKGAISMVDVFCSNTGEILLEILNPCIYKFIDHENISVKQQCKREVIVTKLEKLEKAVPSKSEACQMLRMFGDCWQDSVNRECDSLKAREFISKLSKAAISPCK